MSDRVAGGGIPGRAENLAGVYAPLILAMLFLGVNFSVMRITLAYLPPITSAVARFGGSALVLLGLLILAPGHRTAVRLADIPIIAAMGMAGFAASPILLNYGLLYSSAGEAAIIMGTSPVITVLIASVWLKERVTVTRLVGMAMAFGGVTTIVVGGGGLDISADHLLGDLASLGSAISISSYTVMSKVATRRFSPLATVTFAITAGAFMLIPVVSFAGGWQPFLTAPASAWAAVAFTVVCATVFANVAFCSAVKRIGASSSAIFSNSMTVSAVLTGALVLHEPVTVFHLIGLLLVITGILLATRTSRVAAQTVRPVLGDE